MVKDWMARYIDEDFTDREARKSFGKMILEFINKEKDACLKAAGENEEEKIRCMRTAIRVFYDAEVEFHSLLPRTKEEERESMKAMYDLLIETSRGHESLRGSKRFSPKGLAANSFIASCDMEEEYLWPLFADKKKAECFTPVILAGGLNQRFGKVSKPLQTIVGTPQLTRVIDQLKSAGFEEGEIYAVTKAGYGYQSEPFRFFHQGAGKGLRVNNVSFKDELQRAEVVKRFADGALEFAEQGRDDFEFREEKRELKKNILILHADCVFSTAAPIRMFLERGEKTLDKDNEGYCVFELFKRSDYLAGGPISDICGYAFERESYGKAWENTDKPKGKISISNDVCREIAKGGKFVKSRMLFSNINSTNSYNTALLTSARWKSYDEFVKYVKTANNETEGERPKP